MQVFCDEKTMPIVQVPRNECTFAFTTGDNKKTLQEYDYYLFESLMVFDNKGKIGSYSSNHGKYVSFSFVGSSSFNGSSSSSVYWNETKQMVFYCAWNDSRLAHGVRNVVFYISSHHKNHFFILYFLFLYSPSISRTPSSTSCLR